MAIIECKNVCKNFGEKVALDHVSLEIPEGRIFGLLGPNGAGKTTLIRIINRITIPTDGEVFFNGRPITQADVEKIGYMPEERGLYRKMKVGDQAMYLARLKGMSAREAQDALKEWFVRFGIQSWWDKKVEELCDNIALINKARLVITGGVEQIRRDYGNNNVELVWTDADGRHTEVLPRETDGTSTLRTYLEKDGVQINSYKELMPRMNDIFIKLVTEGEE